MALTKVSYSMINGAPINVLDFGAVGDGITNDTAAIQAALNEGAATGRWVTGAGKTYAVSTVNMLSGQRVQSLYLQSIGPLTSGAVSMQPVVEIDGTSSAKTNMIFRDVRVNGRRQLFTNIDMTGGGQGEDGGMHCWRVVATSAGGVSNILWEDCEGTYAGTAGLAIHDTTPSVSTANYTIQNLTWKGGKLTYNREHGFFADSFSGLQVIDCDCQYNGIDLNTSDPLVSGNRGARSGGYLFGCSFDLETYTGYNGSLWTNFYARNLNCTNCAMPALLYNPIATNVVGYVQPKNIKISDCTFDKGSATGANRPANTDYSFFASGNYTSSGYPYIGLAMNNNRFLQEAPQFNGVTELSVTGGFIESLTYKAHVYNCFGWDVSANGLANKIDLYPAVSFTFTKTQGTSGASISNNTTEYVSSKTGGNDMYRVALTLNGGLAADGDLIYTTVSPISGMYITEAYVSGKSISGTKAIITCSEVDTVSGVAAFNFSTVNNDIIYAELYIVLASSA